MNVDTISDKHLQELERLAGEMLAVIRQAKLGDDPDAEVLRRLHLQLGDARRKRFDTAAREYDGY